LPQDMIVLPVARQSPRRYSGDISDRGEAPMRRRAYAVGIALIIVSTFVVFHPAIAQETGPPGDEPYPIELNAGDTFDVCNSGLIVCPATRAICDDLKVATPVDTPDGLGIKGVGPGSTLCSASSAIGPRRIFRITVR